MDAVSSEPTAARSATEQSIPQSPEESEETLTNELRELKQHLKDANSDLEVLKTARLEAEQTYKALAQELETIETHEKRVVVLIDGDGTVFLPTLIAEGEQGGHEAASRLTTGIESYVGDQQSELHVYVFLKKSDLTSALKCHGHNNSSDKLDEFIMGFNEAYNLFSMVDVGAKKTADNKIRAHLEANIHLTETSKVFFGGCHDTGYLPDLNDHLNHPSDDGKKLVLLPAHTDIPSGFKELGLPSCEISDLFLAANLDPPLPQHSVDSSRTPTPLISALELAPVTGADAHELRETDQKLVGLTESLSIHHGNENNDPPCSS